ncbi:MAG TPA: helix-turn-helix domain-containing protein [Candidatus Dormibacteraeota bacterium]|nr:helix-turn-helix domain-containing protein [Candidatus Dormibacteraeota bacterium]
MGFIPRAVTDPTRQTILDLVRERGTDAVTVDEVAAAVELHRTVAFEHLEMLADAGLLRRGQRGGRRGRPARTYRFTGQAVQFSYPPRQLQMLAGILTTGLGTDGRHLRSAQSAARRAGFDLVSGKRGTASAVRTLSALGGRYRLKGDTLHARNCIFREACADHPVVCKIHAAVIEGALEASGSTRIVRPQGEDGVGGCIYRVGAARKVTVR